MTKMQQSDFDIADTLPIDLPRTKTRAEKLDEFRKLNQSAFNQACQDNCTCTPTRAQMLLIDQYEGRAPID